MEIGTESTGLKCDVIATCGTTDSRCALVGRPGLGEGVVNAVFMDAAEWIEPSIEGEREETELDLGVGVDADFIVERGVEAGVANRLVVMGRGAGMPEAGC